MKALAPAEGALRRRESSEPLKRGTKSPKRTRGPVGELLRRLAGDRDLRPLFKVRTRRRGFMLYPERSSDGAAVGEVPLVESEISGDGQVSACLNRVEVEADSDAELCDGVIEFVDGLQEALGLRPVGTSKFETVLSAGLHPAGASHLCPEERARCSDTKGRR